MGEQGRLNVIDFVISVLREHERSLDDLVERLETLVHSLQQSMKESRALAAAERSGRTVSMMLRIEELERQVEMYKARQVVSVDVLDELYPIEHVNEAKAAV
jgi:hypothetical protein